MEAEDVTAKKFHLSITLDIANVLPALTTPPTPTPRTNKCVKKKKKKTFPETVGVLRTTLTRIRMIILH